MVTKTVSRKKVASSGAAASRAGLTGRFKPTAGAVIDEIEEVGESVLLVVGQRLDQLRGKVVAEAGKIVPAMKRSAAKKKVAVKKKAAARKMAEVGGSLNRKCSLARERWRRKERCAGGRRSSRGLSLYRNARLCHVDFSRAPGQCQWTLGIWH